MTVMVPREKWTDERLDDLNKKVEKGFEETKAEIKTEVKDLRREMDARFEKVDARFDKVDGRFDKMDARFDKMDERFEKMNANFHALNRILIGSAATIIAALLAPNVF